MKHVHHDLIQEWIKDTSRVVERRRLPSHSWAIDIDPEWHPAHLYRFKPAEQKYILVNYVSVPEPVREPLIEGQEFWVAGVTSSWVGAHNWRGTYSGHVEWLSLGLIHLTREAAQAHIDAMLLPSRSDK